MNLNDASWLPATPSIPESITAQVRCDHDRFARDGLPPDLDKYLRDHYSIDMTARYAGLTIKNPWGKASGQLTLSPAQIEEAASAGLGLAVLKTVIASDPKGTQSMADWAIKESRMVCERITSTVTGETGWTITWKGRGWWRSFDDYLELVQSASKIGKSSSMLIAPSVKYHLPAHGETEWRIGEYQETTAAIHRAYERRDTDPAMPIEKDFSPTLAGSSRVDTRATVLNWIRQVPTLIRSATPDPAQLRVGLKLFNTLEDDDFQLAMLAEAHQPGHADFLVHGNRLYDPNREFEGTKGVAYGGPDLSHRNLAVLARFREHQTQTSSSPSPIEWSATGNICSGRIAVEYALRGCTSFQIHTLFQLPSDQFPMRVGTKVEKALHRLYFDPIEGFLIWASHAARKLGLGAEGFDFLDLARLGLTLAPSHKESQ